MSRDREIEKVRFQTNDGAWITSTQRRKSLPTLGSVPTRIRLVDVADSQQHLLAVLVPASNADGLVLMPHAQGIGPRVAIVGSQFVGVLESTNGTIGMIEGTEHDALPILCSTCSTVLTLLAGTVRDVLGTPNTTRRVPRLIVTA